MQDREEGEKGSDGIQGVRGRRRQVQELDARHDDDVVAAVEVENEAVDDTGNDVGFVVDVYCTINGFGGYVGA